MPDRIVELDGVQHHFPSDASDAEIASVLKGSTGPTITADDNMKARRLHGGDTPDTPDWKSNLAGALEPLAHPQSLTDMGNLLIPSGGAAVVGKALAPIGEAIGRYGGAAVKLAGAAGTALLPPAMVTPIRGALKVLGELKPSEWNSPLTVAGREGRAQAAVAGMVDRYKPNISGAIDAGIPQGELPQSTLSMVDRYHPNTSGVPDAGVPQGPLPQHPYPPVEVDRYLPNSGGMPTSATVTPAGGRVPYASSSPSVAESAQAATAAEPPLLTSNGYRLPPEVEAKVRAQLAAQSPVQTGRPPITVSPDSPMQPASDSTMAAPRRSVGAEVVGRDNGMTTQQVRDTTGPIRGEAPGTAAGMPSGPADRIIQKLISMGPKGQGLEETAREAYAAAGNDPKTRLQVQAYLDALRKVGYAIPLMAAPSMLRGRLVQTGQEQ